MKLKSQTPILFDNPLTTSAAHQLRDILAEPTQEANQPQKPNLLQSLETAWHARPLQIGLLLYATFLSALFLAHLLNS